MDSTFIPVVTSVVAALAAIAAALISAHFQRKTARETADAGRQASQIEKLKHDLRRAYGQVAAYYELESIAAEELAALTGKAAKTLKSEMRDEVRSRGLERPEWTRTECERRVVDLGS
ncbi:MAG TPA: hypothetical protein VFV84_09830 [Burkholderiales bacterium]|nr:hypothetical protein [Burkholderiales bacterium]